MPTTYRARRTFLIIATLMIIGGTSLGFQLTQNFYKAFITGENYYKAGNYDAALTSFLEAYAREPHNIKAAGYLLWTYQKLGKKEQAAELLKKIWEENPDDLKVVEQLADGLYGLSDYKSAAELYQIVLKQEDSPRVKRKLAEVLTSQGKYPEAIVLLQALTAAAPDDLQTKEHLADVLSWAKKYDKAIILYKQILRADPEDTQILFKLATVLRYAKKDQEAIVYYRKYLSGEENE